MARAQLPHTPTPTQASPQGGDMNDGQKLHEVGLLGNGLDDNGEDKEHKGKNTIQERRKRQP